MEDPQTMQKLTRLLQTTRNARRAYDSSRCIHDYGFRKYFGLTARERRIVLRGVSWMSEQMYADVAGICNFGRRVHARKQAHPRRLAVKPPVFPDQMGDRCNDGDNPLVIQAVQAVQAVTVQEDEDLK
jgi:hypothetical protein